jgi:type IV secretion system protein VirB10
MEAAMEAMPEKEAAYETTPSRATDMESAGPGFFNRKRVMIILCITFAVVICGGLIININKSEAKTAGVDSTLRAARGIPADFQTQLDRTLVEQGGGAGSGGTSETAVAGEAGIPVIYVDDSPANRLSTETAPETTVATNPPGSIPPPPTAGTRTTSSGSNSGGSGSSSSANTASLPSPYASSMIPSVEGIVYGDRAATIIQAQASSGTYAEQFPYRTSPEPQAAPQTIVPPFITSETPAVPSYASQNASQSLYTPQDSGALTSGAYLGDNSIWIGVIIPAVLETGINTSLPGELIARVTENIYDSRTGKSLLIPQGTLLFARYNSSISYSQNRVQIAWDTLIRPDGYQVDLGGMNGVDARGLSGQDAQYHENWFDYLKAAGLITMFSLANAKMTETAAEYATDETASAIAQSNSEFVNQTGSSIISRAASVQPTLTVDNGTQVNIMLNKTIYLPPVEDYPATKKYTLE